MPLSKYYGGHGEQVAQAMRRKYGADWKRVFYATENKRKKVRKRPRKRVRRRS